MQTRRSPSPDARLKQSESASKASALLDSVVHSIQQPRNQMISGLTNEESLDSVAGLEFSNTNRRHKDLADAIFGSQENERKGPPPKLLLTAPTNFPAISLERSPSPTVVTSHHDKSSPPSGGDEAPTETHSLSPPKKTPSQAELAKEVQRKTHAAMAELHRTPEKADSLRVVGSVGRRRVSPNQISEPKLVSASMSVDAIPLRSSSLSSG